MNDSVSNLANSFSSFLPEWAMPLIHPLVGLAILIIGLFIVKIIASMIKSMLMKVDFLSGTGPEGSTDLASPLASLIKAVLTIFVLIAVLEHFGLTGVLEPLKNLVNEFLGVIPNVIGAGVVGYAGWIIARIVSELVGVGLEKVDAQIADKTGNDELKVSRFGSAFIFAVILLPITVAALGVLDIAAISDPATAMIQKLMAAVPNVVGAAIILLVAYFVARFVVFVITSLLNGMNVNALPEKMGAQTLFSESFTLTRLIGGTIMFFSMLTATTAAVNTLGIDIVSSIFAKVIEFGGGLLIGSVILLIGNFLGSLAHSKLSSHGSTGVANIARFAILGLVLAMGLKAMGLADNIVNMAFGFTLGSVAVAAALSFGLGGKDAAKKIADTWANRIAS